jgi:hypothetical protein
MSETTDIVFISYAREDRDFAERLYMDLRKNEINAWLDSRCLKPGDNWNKEIRRVIRNASYFLLLVSKHSINKRGFVQNEIKEGLRVLEEFPSGQVFMIPARIDQTVPVDEELQALNWVDLFPSYGDGFGKILRTLEKVERLPIAYVDPVVPRHSRGPIGYTPYKSFEDLARRVIELLPDSSLFADLRVPYYITFKTQSDGNKLPDYLLAKYPEEMTIALHNMYNELKAESSVFSVRLSFGGDAETLWISYSAIKTISAPSVGIVIGNLRV